MTLTRASEQVATRAPSTANLPLMAKFRRSVELFAAFSAELRDAEDFSWVFDDIAAYAGFLGRYGEVQLQDARVLEIGYGARPFRLIALQSMGIDAEGVDAESPILDGSLREFAAMLRVNGFERLLKSSVRHIAFDARERRWFVDALRAHQLEEGFQRDRFHVMDAAAFEPDRAYDLIISEDVFEHIAPGSLRTLVPKMARWLRPGGIALIRPNVFTGITGGHALDWTRHSFTRPRHRLRSEPWDHLRARQYQANTYLNEFSRAQYRELFSTAFEILEEEVALPDLGREFLDDAIRQELSTWSEEELLSNQVRMVLRPIDVPR